MNKFVSTNWHLCLFDRNFILFQKRLWTYYNVMHFDSFFASKCITQKKGPMYYHIVCKCCRIYILNWVIGLWYIQLCTIWFEQRRATTHTLTLMLQRQWTQILICEFVNYFSQIHKSEHNNLWSKDDFPNSHFDIDVAKTMDSEHIVMNLCGTFLLHLIRIKRNGILV